MTPAEYNRQLPAPGDYARSWKALLSMDPKQSVSVPGWIVGMPGWGQMSRRACEVLECVREAAASRINARAGFQPREPREGDIQLRRDSRRIRDIHRIRLRVYQFETPTAQRRFSHLLASRND